MPPVAVSLTITDLSAFTIAPVGLVVPARTLPIALGNFDGEGRMVRRPAS